MPEPKLEKQETTLEIANRLKNNPDFKKLISRGVGRSWLLVEIRQAEREEEQTPTQRVHGEQVREANAAPEGE